MRVDFTARLALLALAATLLTGGVSRKAATANRGGNREYANKNYDKAATLYDEALARAPESASISYNLGNALYRQQKFADAAVDLRRAAGSDDAVLRQQSCYNLGNSFFKMGKLPEALDSYRRALDLAPGDRDAKINYEKVLRQLQQQQQQQKQQQKQQDGQSSQGQEDKDSKPQPQDSKAKEQEQSQGQEQQAQEQQADQGQQQQQEQQPQMAGADTAALAAGDLRPEEAKRILEAMRQQEKELQKERARLVRARSRRAEKDW